MPIHKPITAKPEELRTLAGEIAAFARDLATISDAAKDAGFSDLPVTGYGQMRDAAKFTNNFVAAVKNALWKAKEERGDFGAIPPEERNGKAHHKPRRPRRPKPASD
jgi:hypothetical protein